MQSILLNNSTVRSRHPSQTSSESSTSDSNYPPRTIRFAPLPDPRKNGDSAVFYPDDSDSDTPSPSSATLECPPSPRFSFKTISHKSRSNTWSNLLRPLFKSGLNNSTQDSTDTVYKAGVALSRRRSTGCNSVASSKEVDRAAVYRDGAPLTHINSDSGSRRTAHNNAGHRMLNGRVYGGRRPSSTASQSESYEPDFVEWGYGGMGSVNNSTNKDPRTRGVDWAKVQSSGKFIDYGDADVDDGSGMQWVRRRREQRERERKERESCESSQQIIPEITIHPPTHDANQTMDGNSYSSDRNDDHHVYQAINIPAPHYRHRPNKPFHGSAHPSALLTSSETSLQKADLSSGTSSNGNSSDTEENQEDSDTERDSSSDDDEDDVEQVIYLFIRRFFSSDKSTSSNSRRDSQVKVQVLKKLVGIKTSVPANFHLSLEFGTSIFRKLIYLTFLILGYTLSQCPS